MKRFIQWLAPAFLICASAIGAHYVLPLWEPQGKPLLATTTPAFDFPEDPTSIFLNNMHNELSQPLLYHRIGPSIDRARNTDILFFGNSRAQLGLREEFILPLAKQRGLDVFSVACGNAEGGGFLLELIRKHDLRPKVLVLSGEPETFQLRMSPRAKHAMQLSRWQARQEVFEGRAAWEIRRRLHRRLPKLDPWDPPTFDRWVEIYRSQATGWWQPVWERGSRYEFEYPKEIEGEKFERTHDFMEQLTEELDKRGTLLVITAVPWGRNSRFAHLPYLGGRYDIPVVPPLLADGMATLDGSHLDRPSAQRASRVFWSRFLHLPPVRERLGLIPLG